MGFLKNFWVKLFAVLLAVAIIAVGVWYFYLLKKPEFFPNKITFSQDENTAYIAAFQKFEIYDNSRRELNLINTSFGNETELVAGGDGRVYIADLNQGKVFVYLGNSLAVEIGAGLQPRFLFLDGKTQKLFVYNRGSRDLTVVDVGKNYEVSSTIKINADINGGALDEKSGLLYLSDTNSDNVIVIDSGSFKVSNLKVGFRPYISFPAAFDGNAQRLYLTSKDDSKLWVIDTGARKVLNSISISRDTEEMTLGSQRNKLYLASPNDHAIFVFDVGNLSSKKITLSPLLYPQKAVADEKNGRIYVFSQSRINEITVLDMEGKVLKSIQVGFPLSDLKFSPKTETLYALSRAGGFMMTIKSGGNPKFVYKKPKIVESKINWPNNLRVDRVTKKLYVLSDFSNSYLSFEPDKLNLLNDVKLGGGPYYQFSVGTGPTHAHVINGAINEIWRFQVASDGKLSVKSKIKSDKRLFSGIGFEKIEKSYISAENALIVVDGKTDKVAKVINLDSIPQNLTADLEKNKIYFSVGDSINIVDGENDSVKTLIEAAGNKKIIFDKSNSNLVLFDGKSLRVIDETGKILRNITLNENYQEIAIAPWLKKIYLLNSSGNKLSVLYSNSLKEIASIDINEFAVGTPAVTNVYPDEKTNKIFVTHRYGQITVIDAISNKILKTINLPYAANPVSLRTDPESNRLYVANKWLNQIQVYSLTDYTLQAEIDAYGKTTWFK